MKAFLLWPVLMTGLTAAGCAAHVAYVRVPPPPARVEAYGYAPGPGYVWIQGYWRWGGRGYAWAPGYWVRPPRPAAVWVPGHWVSTPSGYYWRAGHWR